MSDIGARADDYERRLANAPSTEAIIGGLVKSVASSKRAVRLLAISLVVDILLSTVLGVLSVVAYNNASRIEINSLSIQRSTEHLASEVYNQCLQDQGITREVVVVYETIIGILELTKSLPPAEKVDRIQKYKDAMPAIRACSKP